MSPESAEPTTELLPGVELRSYQMECVQVLKGTRADGETKALIHMATGLGKTITAALDLHEFLIEQPDARILFLCHRTKIIDQARRVFEEKLGVHNLSFGTLRRGALAESIPKSQFVFATFQSMDARLERGSELKKRDLFNPYDFDYVMVDEAHHSTASTYLPTIQYFAPQFLLAMSATPDRSDDQDIRKVFGNEKFVMDLGRGLAEGWLAKPHYVAVTLKADAGHMKSELIGEYARELSESQVLIETGDDLKKRTAHLDNPKILVFCNTIKEAKEFARVWGEDARAIHSKQGRHESDQMLADFHAGNIRVLASVDMIGEGIDVPDIDVVAFLRSTQSEMVFFQQLGRGLRKTKARTDELLGMINAKEDVMVFDYVANYQRLMMLGQLVRRMHSKPRARTKDEEDESLAELLKGRGKLRFPHAEFIFADNTIDILRLYLERRGELKELSKIGREEAIAKYKIVWEKLGKYPTVGDIRVEFGSTALRFILMPFGGFMGSLHKAATGLPDIEDADAISLSDLARETNNSYPRMVRYRNESNPRVAYVEAVRAGAIVRLMARQSIPAFVAGFQEHEAALEKSIATERVNARFESEPKNWIDVGTAADDLGVSYVEIMRLIKEYGIAVKRVNTPNRYESTFFFMHRRQLDLLRLIQQETATLR